MDLRQLPAAISAGGRGATGNYTPLAAMANGEFAGLELILGGGH
jgi:hypothetical protein